MPVACLFNNWIEVRSDAAKICTSQRRPIPQREDSIGPWLDNISFLAWLGSLTTSTLIYFFGRDDVAFKFDKTAIIYLLITFLVAEHGYWVVDRVVGTLLQRFKTQGEIDLEREDYVLRRKHLSDMPGLVWDHSSEDTMENVSSDEHGFWRRRGIEGTMIDAKEVLSRGRKGRKVQ